MSDIFIIPSLDAWEFDMFLICVVLVACLCEKEWHFIFLEFSSLDFRSLYCSLVRFSVLFDGFQLLCSFFFGLFPYKSFILYIIYIIPSATAICWCTVPTFEFPISSLFSAFSEFYITTHRLLQMVKNPFSLWLLQKLLQEWL